MLYQCVGEYCCKHEGCRKQIRSLRALHNLWQRSIHHAAGRDATAQESEEHHYYYGCAAAADGGGEVTTAMVSSRAMVRSTAGWLREGHVNTLNIKAGYRQPGRSISAPPSLHALRTNDAMSRASIGLLTSMRNSWASTASEFRKPSGRQTCNSGWPTQMSPSCEAQPFSSSVGVFAKVLFQRTVDTLRLACLRIELKYCTPFRFGQGCMGSSSLSACAAQCTTCADSTFTASHKTIPRLP